MVAVGGPGLPGASCAVGSHGHKPRADDQDLATNHKPNGLGPCFMPRQRDSVWYHGKRDWQLNLHRHHLNEVEGVGPALLLDLRGKKKAPAGIITACNLLVSYFK